MVERAIAVFLNSVVKPLLVNKLVNSPRFQLFAFHSSKVAEDLAKMENKPSNPAVMNKWFYRCNFS